MDAAEVMPGADGDAVLARIAAAAERKRRW